MNGMFSIIPAIVAMGFIVVFGIIIVAAVKGIGQWNRNNNSPVLTVECVIVAKRMSVSHHTHHTGDNIAMGTTMPSTTYYATFQVQSGDRMELRVPDREYGLLAEGDRGRLTFQGTRYLGFERVGMA